MMMIMINPITQFDSYNKRKIQLVLLKYAGLGQSIVSTFTI